MKDLLLIFDHHPHVFIRHPPYTCRRHNHRNQFRHIYPHFLIFTVTLQLCVYAISAIAPAYYIPVPFLDDHPIQANRNIRATVFSAATADISWVSTQHPIPWWRSFLKRISVPFRQWIFRKGSYYRRITTSHRKRNKNIPRLVKQKNDSIISFNSDKTTSLSSAAVGSNQTSPIVSFHPPPSQSQQQQAHSGWIPYEFPNPLVESDACGLSKLTSHHEISVNDKYHFADMYNSTQRYTDTSSLSSSPLLLLLCDPDSLLDIQHFQRIADALQNFTFYYGNKNDNWNSDRMIRSSFSSSSPYEEIEQVKEDSKPLRQRLMISTSQGIQQNEIPIFNTEQNHHHQQQHQPQSLFTSAASILESFFSSFLYDNNNNNKNMIYFLPSSIPKTTQVSLHWLPPVEIGIAMIHKMDIASILRSNGYYTFEDAEGMINDAAQIFASILLDEWWKQLNTMEARINMSPIHYNTHDKHENIENDGILNPKDHHQQQQQQDEETYEESNPTNNKDEPVTSGVLIFLSLQDRVCFITASEDISDILPWWRLDHVVTRMKTNLQTGELGQALLQAIAGISHMLDAGPPSMEEKLHDFVSRFGFVLSFALFTFLFAILGEFRDRRQKVYRADIRSRLTHAEKIEAKKLQQEYNTSSCPICLESFQIESEDGLKRVDSFGIPILGTDGLPLKLLRCGHIMDMTCWLNWVKTGHGASLKCPVCREDLGSHSHRKVSRGNVTSTSLVLQETESLTANTRHSRTYGSLSRCT